MNRLPNPFACLVAIGFGLIGVVTGLLYLFPDWQASQERLAALASFIPYGILGWLASAIVILITTSGRGRWVMAPALIGLVAHSLIIWAYFDPTNLAPASTKPTLTVMELNMRYGQANTDQLLTEVKSVQPDVLVLTEFTDLAGAVLTNGTWQQLFPYHLGTIGKSGFENRWFGDASGTQVLSRTPITELGRTTDTGYTNLAVRVEHAGSSFVLVAAHPRNPTDGVADWVNDAQAVTALIQRFSGQPLVVAGDLNAVPEHVTLRRLLAATGLHEAIRGFQPTYPADRLVPLIRIDHILATSDFQTVTMATFKVTGTDHLGIVAELVQS